MDALPVCAVAFFPDSQPQLASELLDMGFDRCLSESFNEEHLAALENIAQQVPLQVVNLLSEDEVVALKERVDWLLENKVLPYDPSGRRVPWPLL